MSNPTDPLLTVSQVAEWLHVHPNTVKRMSDRGEFPVYRIGSRGDRRYRVSDIDKFINRNSSIPAENDKDGTPVD